MARRPTLLFYVATLLTSGLFAGYWLYAIMRDVNLIAGKDVFLPARRTAALIVVFLMYIGLIVVRGRLVEAGIGRQSGEYWEVVALLFVTVLYAILVTTLVSANRHIDALSARRKQRTATVALLTLAWFASFPYTQSKLNRLAAQ